MNTTPEALIKEYADPIEQQEIDKFVCAEMGRQIHRYIKEFFRHNKIIKAFSSNTQKSALSLHYARHRAPSCFIREFD